MGLRGGVRIWIRDGAYKEARCIGKYACMDIIVYDHSTVKKVGRKRNVSLSRSISHVWAEI